jgi:hypothetical protein
MSQPDAETAALYAASILGKDAEQFLRSDLGRTLIGMAEQDAEEATESLKRVWPWRQRKIQQLQNQIWRAESFKGWLRELVIQGEQALQQLEDRE